MMETLYRDNYSTVYGYLLSLGADSVTAEDITAEVFLRAIQRLSNFDGRCKISTWLCAIGKNLYYDERRRQKRNLSLEEYTAPELYSVEETYIEKDLAKQIYHTARQLESPYREVFFMRLEGLSFRQISGALGKTENWSRVTYFRAKAKIWDRIGGEVWSTVR